MEKRQQVARKFLKRSSESDASKLTLIGLVLLLNACSGSDYSNIPSPVVTPPAPPTYTIGGTMAGLQGGPVTLLINGANALKVTANGSFTFANAATTGSSYAVTVGTQPPGQTCSVATGSGTIASANISTVAINCAAAAGTSFYSFTNANNNGNDPYSEAMTQASDGNFYGTTYYGGLYSNGTVFKITPDGTETVLWSFGQTSAEGSFPASQVMQASDGNLYGMTYEGGANNNGTLFKLTLDGVETVLHTFNVSSGDGGFPGYYGPATLLQANDGNLYGVAAYGGLSNQGIVFKYTSSGTYSILYKFGTNGGAADGANPFGGLVQGADGALYGTTYEGGANNEGTLFKLTLSGTESILHSFTSAEGCNLGTGLTIGTDGKFYGAAAACGMYNHGSFFQLTTSGTFTLLHNFGANADDPFYTWITLVLGSDGNFYGVSSEGGANGTGSLYKVTSSGTVTSLYSFSLSGTTDGSYPMGLTIGMDGYFYVLTYDGGANNLGAVFKY